MFTRSVRNALGLVSCAAVLAGFSSSEPDTTELLKASGPVAPAAVPLAAAAPSTPTLAAARTTTQNATRYSLGNVSFSRGRLYVAFLTLSETGGAVDRTPRITGTGTSWTRIDARQASSATMGLTAYHFRPTRRIAGVALRTGTLSSRHEGVQFSVVEVAANVDKAEPVAQHAAGRAGPAKSFTRRLPAAPDADSLVVASFAHGANEGSNPNAGWRQVRGSDRGHSSPARGAHVIYDNTDPGAAAGSTWATTSQRRGIVVEVPSATTSVVAAADMCGDCADTADRVKDIDPDAVVTMGDLAYQNGLLSQFQQNYGGGTNPQTRWGSPSIKNITLPGYGNHDCYDAPRADGTTKQGCEDAVAYFGPDDSFGTDISGTPGSYHTVLGNWLVVHLNSAGQRGSGRARRAEISEQNAALQDILASDRHRCEMVLWHHPRYSSGEHQNTGFVNRWFDTAYANGVDVILNGHDHDYERFAPQDDAGNLAADGIRQFVVGTGGTGLRPFGTTQPNSQKRIRDKGVLSMELGGDLTYRWQFVDDLTGAVDDAGSDTCHP